MVYVKYKCTCITIISTCKNVNYNWVKMKNNTSKNKQNENCFKRCQVKKLVKMLLIKNH